MLHRLFSLSEQENELKISSYNKHFNYRQRLVLVLALEDTPGHLKSPSQLAVHRLINWHEIYSRRVVVSIIFSKIRVWVLVVHTTPPGD